MYYLTADLQQVIFRRCIVDNGYNWRGLQNKTQCIMVIKTLRTAATGV